MLLLLFGAVLTVNGENSPCNCPDSKINHVSAISFGITLLSPSYSSVYLNISADYGAVINEPSEPISFAENHYYWDNEYFTANESHFTVCNYHIAYHNKELRKIKYNVTHRPSNITFGCNWYQECCELGCCLNSLIQIGILILLYTGIAFMAVIVCAQLTPRSNDQRGEFRSPPNVRRHYPCRRVAAERTVESYVLQELAIREAPPAYEELYPNGSPYEEAGPSTSNTIPRIVVNAVEDSENTDTN
ncbi:hypothetical protein L5515_007795 [Caenorhabditis briggsae]|uniref:CX domain-containing protein n=1 Tax=Caenorhabditis briggsae TaxID=6238 RepID=A0AAE9F5A0_CAEBR|nr:hypothetical protein L5515_007795 [Caenorhabditis briggsae]